MKKSLIALTIVAALSLSGCAAVKGNAISVLNEDDPVKLVELCNARTESLQPIKDKIGESFDTARKADKPLSKLSGIAGGAVSSVYEVVAKVVGLGINGLEQLNGIDTIKDADKRCAELK